MIKAFQWDLARQVERLDWLLAQLPRYAEWGYRELYLHLEDAVEFPSLPGVARRDAYSRRQLGRLVDAAGKVGIGVVPIVNLLGHTQYLVKVPRLRDLNELRAPDGSPLERGQVCPLHPAFMGVAEALVRDIAPFCTAGKLHVGLDESFHLGRHPLSRAEIARIGLAGHLAGHVGRLEALIRPRGLRLGMWADMLALIPETIPLLPAGIIAYDWYYYPFGRLPRIELRNFGEYDLAPALRARGIEYWGCPMNASFRYEPLPVFGERLANIRSWWQRCTEVEAAGILVTSWEPDRLALEMAVVVDAAAASLWLDPGHDDAPGMLESGFRRVYGASHARERAVRALACDERAYAGCWRWELNDRWDTAPSRLGLSRFQAERSFYRRLAARSGALPKPFRMSVAFRLFLAERDVFVRSTAAALLALRRRLASHGALDPTLKVRLSALQRHVSDFRPVATAGRKAARELWRLTRDPRRSGPNERMVVADTARLASLDRWVAGCTRDPSKLMNPSPVCGAWQLVFETVLTEPALQRIVVEERRPGGPWREVFARTLIEFRAAAARPNARIRREVSLPLEDPKGSLRISVRGVGRVGLSNVVLTDGVRELEPRNQRPRHTTVIGKAAAASGFPDLDWSRNLGSLTLAPWKQKRRPR